MFRDSKIWLKRASECRNPIILGQAFAYDLQRFKLLKLAAGLSHAQSRQLLREIEDDYEFIGEIRERLSKWSQYRPRALDFMMFPGSGSVFLNEVTLYAVVRARRPQVMIETGGTPGKSTAFILRAMALNNTGHLYTIDLPPPEITENKLDEHDSWHEQRPANLASNWAVPDSLRTRHTLLLGTSREHLPSLPQALGHTDIFFHDSDHSYENMMWEFETAFPALSPQGLLLSGDVLANTSFFEFCQDRRLRFARVYNLGAALNQ